MSDGHTGPSDSDYVLLPSVTHPGGREKAFDDAFKAMVRAMIEVNDNATLAYAIDKTDRILTEETMDSLPAAEVAEWHEACDEFESMSAEAQHAWVKRVLTEYPKIDELPGLDGYYREHETLNVMLSEAKHLAKYAGRFLAALGMTMFNICRSG